MGKTAIFLKIIEKIVKIISYNHGNMVILFKIIKIVFTSIYLREYNII